MKITFSGYFNRQLKKIKDKIVLEDVYTAILNVESALNKKEINNLKKLSGYDHTYRIKIGQYRIGITIENDIVDFCAVAHRKDIYKLFP